MILINALTSLLFGLRTGAGACPMRAEHRLIFREFRVNIARIAAQPDKPPWTPGQARGTQIFDP